MLEENTLVDTNYGVYKIGNVAVGMFVRTTEGWNEVTGKVKNMLMRRKYRIWTDKGIIILCRNQKLYQDNVKRRVIKLRPGQTIDTFDSTVMISKMRQLKDYRTYCALIVNSYDGNFFLHNEIKVCGF